MNEKERADHADSRYKLLQSQNSQIEKVAKRDLVLSLNLKYKQSKCLHIWISYLTQILILAQWGAWTEVCRY